MNFRKIFSLTLLLFGCYLISYSQIQFKIDLLNDKDLYQVSLVSDQDFTYPNNIIGTAQISIKAPVLGFELGEITSLLENVSWESNAIIAAPEEAKDFQYIAIGLSSTGVPFPLTKAVEIPLFTFKNMAGNCPGEVALIDNNQDAFLPPNSRNANIGNQITPFGCLNLTNKNAYSGNLETGIANCLLSTSLELLDKNIVLDMAVYPNPADDWLKLTIHSVNLKDKIEYQIWGTGGKLIKNFSLDKPLTTDIEQILDIKLLAAGQYTLSLRQGSKTINKNFVKILR